MTGAVQLLMENESFGIWKVNKLITPKYIWQQRKHTCMYEAPLVSVMGTVMSVLEMLDFARLRRWFLKQCLHIFNWETIKKMLIKNMKITVRQNTFKMSSAKFGPFYSFTENMDIWILMNVNIVFWLRFSLHFVIWAKLTISQRCFR